MLTTRWVSCVKKRGGDAQASIVCVQEEDPDGSYGSYGFRDQTMALRSARTIVRASGQGGVVAESGYVCL